jgi:hypothetical protein
MADQIDSTLAGFKEKGLGTMKTDRLRSFLWNMRVSENELEFIHPEHMEARLSAFQLSAGAVCHKIGQSRLGRNIFALEIGRGKQRVLAVAGAHADEPTGTIALLKLADELTSAENKDLLEFFTFSFIPMLDPDGTAMNWKWLKNPPSFKKMALYSIRNNDPAEDLEHCIPVSDNQRILPEAKAFKDFVDSRRGLHSYTTLHNLHLAGGPLFILSAAEAKSEAFLIQFMTKACHDHGLELMDLDLHGEKGIYRLAPGFLTPPLIQDMLDNYRGRKNVTDRIRMATYQYAAESCGAKISLITEVPLFAAWDLNDTRQTLISRYDLELEKLRRSKTMLESFISAWNKLDNFSESDDSRTWSRYYETLISFAKAKIDAGYRDAERFKGIYARMNELFDLFVDDAETQFKIGLMGIRRLAGLDSLEAQRAMEHHQNLFQEGFERFTKRVEYEPVPLSHIVKLQITAVLAGAFGG